MANHYQSHLETLGEYGVVEQIHHPIVEVSGLPGAHQRELVVFENGEYGEVFLLEKHSLQILVFSKEPLSVGMKVARTGNVSSVPVGDGLLGKTVNPLGQPLSNKITMPPLTQRREMDIHPLGISERAKIRLPFTTGVAIVDMMVPLGRGQKELIIGDRKTGKSAFLLAVIKNQVAQGTVAIYVTIAKKKSDIKKIQLFLEKENIMQQTIIVATTSSDSPSLIYLAPYAALSIAEYFRDQGRDVVVVLDDLSTHAKFYREISLLANRFPGRDSYPGDIFYTHARLLERSGNYKHKSGKDVSVTILPVVEIVEGDFTGYIATNIMSMTDGHIFFDSNIYYQGRRPAVNILLSVTRVGRQTQSDLVRSINRELTSFFALYEKMQNLSHFGAELTDTVINILKMGETIYTLFNQPYDVVIPLEIQLVLFTILWLKLVENPDGPTIANLRNAMLTSYQQEQNKAIFQDIVNIQTFNDLLGNVARRKEEIFMLCKTNSKT